MAPKGNLPGFPTLKPSLEKWAKGRLPGRPKEIEVNEPMRYNGLTFYQSFYGEMPGRQVVAKVHDKTTEERTAVHLTPGAQAKARSGDRHL